MPTEHNAIKASIREHMLESHARVDADVEKLQNHPDYVSLPRMVKCYVDIVVLDIDLLKKQALIAHDHIDRLDEMLDRHQTTP